MMKKIIFQEHIYDDSCLLDGIFRLYSIPKTKKITEMRRDLYFEDMSYATTEEKIQCFITMKEKVAGLNKNLRNMFHIHNKIKMYIIMKTFNIECGISAFDINVIDAKIVLHQGHILSTPNALFILFTDINEYFYLEFSQK